MWLWKSSRNKKALQKLKRRNKYMRKWRISKSKTLSGKRTVYVLHP